MSRGIRLDYFGHVWVGRTSALQSLPGYTHPPISKRIKRRGTIGVPWTCIETSGGRVGTQEMSRLQVALFMCSMTSLLVPNSSSSVAAEQDADAASQVELTRYKEALSVLDTADLDSVQEGLQLIGARLEGASADDRDAAFLAFREFFYDVEQDQNREERPDGVEFEENFLKTLEKNGFRLVGSEGFWYVDEHPDFLHKKFGELVSEPIGELLRIRVEEIDEGTFDDAALVVSFKNIADRVRTWDRYLSKYPDSPLLDEAKYFYRLYLHTLLEGVEQ